ncbi:protein-tyrosine phosphatase family protein [Providencia stuartii]|uniref:protein-tyrosine phosphatase family protein n=1 Tax=Providencia stuartii TaxID=588 RepID=UPI00112431E4|nr:protein-tyrosine phosphatase family protein [Providencia stuartii]
MLPISHTSRIAVTSCSPNQLSTKPDLSDSASFINQISEIKNTPTSPQNTKSEMPISGSLRQRRQRASGLKLNLLSTPKVVTDQVSSDFEKLKVNLENNYTRVDSSRYPEVTNANKTQVSFTDENTKETVGLAANYLQIAGKNIAIRTQYPKDATSAIEQHLKMLMEEKPSVLVVIASQNDIDGANLQSNPEKRLPLYFNHDASYGSIDVKSESGDTLKYADQVNADSYQLTLIKANQTLTLPVIHITNWNDRTTISAEALRTLAIKINSKGEMPVIHCLSGSGRTGAIAAAMQLTQPDNQYSAYQVVESLRNTGTPHMVQTEEQYRTLTELEG